MLVTFIQNKTNLFSLKMYILHRLRIYKIIHIQKKVYLLSLNKIKNQRIIIKMYNHNKKIFSTLLNISKNKRINSIPKKHK